MGYTLNFAPVWRDFDLLLSGLGLGLFLAVVSIAIGCVIGLIVAFGRISRHAVLRSLSAAYVTAIRNTPILVLILFSYFALPRSGAISICCCQDWASAFSWQWCRSRSAV